jgi:hypothetical protein
VFGDAREPGHERLGLIALQFAQMLDRFEQGGLKNIPRFEAEAELLAETQPDECEEPSRATLVQKIQRFRRTGPRAL